MNDEDLLRYSRQIMLPEVDIQGQEKLLESRVLVVGLGGLGSPVSMYLAAAGVGCLVLADFDRVDLSNLQRQIVHRTGSVGEAKVSSAAATLRGLNPAVDIVALDCRLSDRRLLREVGAADVVVDCSDNFTTRFALNQACVAQKTPLVSGAAIRLEGQVAVFDSRIEGAPCYRCLYDAGEDENLSCAESGVLAPLVGIVGSVQALEAIKLLLGFGDCLVGRLLILDAKTMAWRALRLPQDQQCPVCSGSVTAPGGEKERCEKEG